MNHEPIIKLEISQKSKERNPLVLIYADNYYIGSASGKVTIHESTVTKYMVEIDFTSIHCDVIDDQRITIKEPKQLEAVDSLPPTAIQIANTIIMLGRELSKTPDIISQGIGGLSVSRYKN